MIAASNISAGNLSGQVVTLAGKPLQGVTVFLAGHPSSTVVTDQQGEWTLTGVMGLRSPTSKQSNSIGNLSVHDGKLSIRFKGADISGRLYGGKDRSATISRNSAARATQFPDTLIYSYNDTVFLRDTVSSNEQSGLLRVRDTLRNPSIIHGYFIDARDGRQYRYVTIGTQVWMAENLSLNGKIDYRWHEVMDIEARYDTVAWNGDTTGHKGICPTGWHVPTQSEVRVLLMNPGEPALVVRSGEWDRSGFNAARNMAIEDFWSSSIQFHGQGSGFGLAENPFFHKYHTILTMSSEAHLRCLRD